MDNIASTGRDDAGSTGSTGSTGVPGVAGGHANPTNPGADNARRESSAGNAGSAGSEGSADVGTVEGPDTEVADTTALPVALSMHGRDGDAIRRWVEGTLGWQPVDGVTDALVPPAVVLRDLGVQAASDPGHFAPGGCVLPGAGRSAIGSGSPSGGEVGNDIPVVLVTPDDALATEAAAQAVKIGPAAVVGWPSGRDHLDAVVRQVLARPRTRRRHARTIRVGGAAGGVGTTTVAFALGGLSAWRSQRSVVAVRGAGVAGREVPTAALAAADVYSHAEPLAGMADLRALKLTDRARIPELVDQTVDTLIVDVGVDVDADVLVCRRDAAGRQMVAETAAAAVVVVGDGPVAHKELVELAAGRPVISVPWSARVARAGAIARLPASLPGAWLRRLAPLTPAASQSATPESEAARSATSTPVTTRSVAPRSVASGSVATGSVESRQVGSGSAVTHPVASGPVASGSVVTGPVPPGSVATGSPALDVVASPAGTTGSAVSR